MNIIFLIIEGISLIIWIVIGAYAMLFTKPTQLWWVWVPLIITLLVFATSTVLSYHASNHPAYKGIIIAGFVIALLASLPSIEFKNIILRTQETKATTQEMISKHIADGTPFNETELEAYIVHLQESDPTTERQNELRDFLQKKVVNSSAALENADHLPLPFLKIVLEFKPSIISNGSLVEKIITSTYDDTFVDSDNNVLITKGYNEKLNERLEKFSLLLKYGLNTEIKDHVAWDKKVSAIDVINEYIKTDSFLSEGKDTIEKLQSDLAKNMLTIINNNK